MSCATDGCDDPNCGPCTVNQRFAHVLQRQALTKDTDGLRDDAKALNGFKGRASRDPALIKRKRKALTP